MRCESEAARRVREAAERSRWLLDYERKSHDAPQVAWDPSWVPTAAEARFLGRDAMLGQFRSALGAVRRGSHLHAAAYLAGMLVEAEHLTEEEAKGALAGAARRAGFHVSRSDNTISDGYSLALEHCLTERHPASPNPVGGFSAVASASSTWDDKHRFSVAPNALLPLPVAVLVHAGHGHRTDAVGVAIPSFVDGAVLVDAVFATRTTRARDSWTLTRKQRLDSVSISARPLEWHSGDRGQLIRGVLTAVDLVRSPADEKALVTKVVDGRALTAGQRETQRLLDDYLADPNTPCGIDLSNAAGRSGAAAMDCLAGVVAPMLEERGKCQIVGISR